MTDEKTWRQVNVEKATAANRLRKWRRWAEEMRLNGWTVQEPAK